MSEAEAEQQGDAEHQVSPLELFFDLVFVFAITQVTSLLARDPTWHGVLRALLVLAALWSAWNGFAWLTSTWVVTREQSSVASRSSPASRSQTARGTGPAGFPFWSFVS